MKCFENLVKSHFIANISAELELARKIIKDTSQFSTLPTIFAKTKDRKKLYDDYVYAYYLKEEIDETELSPKEEGLIYFLQMDDIIFVYSLCKSQLDEAVHYNYYVSGNLPIHRSRHKSQGQLVHTVLFDKKLSFEPISPN